MKKAISLRSRHSRMLLAGIQAEFGWTPMKAFGVTVLSLLSKETRRARSFVGRTLRIQGTALNSACVIPCFGRIQAWYPAQRENRILHCLTNEDFVGETGSSGFS
jgi:hypothetical protein